jgi:hypothetical protein
MPLAWHLKWGFTEDAVSWITTSQPTSKQEQREFSGVFTRWIADGALGLASPLH